jgi:hypothetical protein
MTPMACAISDAYKHQFIFIGCFLESFISPSEPIYWIVGVLQQIGAFRMD